MRLVSTFAALTFATAALVALNATALGRTAFGATSPLQDTGDAPGGSSVLWEPATTLSFHFPKPDQLPEGVTEVGVGGAQVKPYWHGGHNGGAILSRLDGNRIGLFLGVTVETSQQNIAMDGTRVVWIDDMDREHIVEADSCAAGATAMLFVAPPRYGPHRYRAARVEIDANGVWVQGR